MRLFALSILCLLFTSSVFNIIAEKGLENRHDQNPEDAVGMLETSLSASLSAFPKKPEDRLESRGKAEKKNRKLARKRRRRKKKKRRKRGKAKKKRRRKKAVDGDEKDDERKKKNKKKTKKKTKKVKKKAKKKTKKKTKKRTKKTKKFGTTGKTKRKRKGGVKDGKKCKEDRKCRDGRCSGGVCRMKHSVSNGKSCHDADDCMSKYCLKKVSASEKHCVRYPLANGLSCQVNKDCESDRCRNKKCVHALLDGEKCTENSQCYHSRCSAGICRKRGSGFAGESCAVRKDCESGSCFHLTKKCVDIVEICFDNSMIGKKESKSTIVLSIYEEQDTSTIKRLYSRGHKWWKRFGKGVIRKVSPKFRMKFTFKNLKAKNYCHRFPWTTLIPPGMVKAEIGGKEGSFLDSASMSVNGEKITRWGAKDNGKGFCLSTVEDDMKNLVVNKKHKSYADLCDKEIKFYVFKTHEGKKAYGDKNKWMYVPLASKS